MSSAATRLSLSIALFVFLAGPLLLVAQTPTQPLIQQPVNESNLVRLKGNTHPLARAEFDQGAAPADLPMERMLLVLKRSPEQDAALLKLLDDQQDKVSASYHKWLTPEQFGRQFGPADSDIQTITAWLQNHSFTVNQVTKGRTAIEFSGTAAQVQEAFHTTIHKYLVNGESHWANASDPEIPAALVPAVAGVVSLHNFLKQPQIKISKTRVRAKIEKGSQPQITFSDGTHALTPADYSKIYNISPLLPQGIAGLGVTIAVLGRSNLFNGGEDVRDFEEQFDPLCCGTVQTILNGPDPGDLGGGEEAEATLDNTWAGALAPNAQIDFVLSATTNTTDGVDLSEVYAIDQNVGQIMTESFSICEQAVGNAELQSKASLAEQAAAQGITYFVASGDSGAAGCDNPNLPPAQNPPGINALASSGFTVAVGGTEFNENGQSSKYWSSQNNQDGSSVLSYIPEDVWNESSLTAGLWSSGGGTSIFFSKPSWQSGVSGIPPNNFRNVPDVALTAAGHDGYLLCLEGSCVPDDQGFITLYIIGGTSASTPSFASVMALVDQKSGAPQGQANYVLYSLAGAENSTLSQCNASKTSGLPGSSCVFNDVTVGNNSVPGVTGFSSTVGYDLATGLGSVNVNNLVNNWATINFRATTTTLTPSSINATHGSSVNLGVSVAPNSGTGTPTGDVSLQTSLISAPGFIDAFPPAQAGFLTLNNGSASAAVSDLPGGTYTLTAQYGGDAVFGASPASSPISVTISPEDSSTTLSLFTVEGGNLVPFTGGPFGSLVLMRADASSKSSQGIPTGSVEFIDKGNSVGVLNLNSEGNTITPNGYFGFSAGQHSLVAQYRADNSFNASNSAAAKFTITQASTSATLQPVSGAVLQGNSVTLTATLTSPAFAGAPFNLCADLPCEPTSGFPTAGITFFVGSTQLGTASLNGNQVTGNGITGAATLNTSALPLGQDTVSAQFAGDSNYLASTAASITVNVQADFTVSPASNSVTIGAPGGSGTLAITVTGNPGYNSTINFTSSSCSGLPRESTCSFNPPSLTGSGQTTLTITTTAPRSAVANKVQRWTGNLGLVFAGVVLLGVSSGRRRLGTILAGAAVAIVLVSVSCGGSSNNTNGGGGGDPGTPVGTSTVTVTAATTTGLSHTATFNLTVQ